MTARTETIERSRAAMPSDTSAILERRDLASGNPRLAQLLHSGMTVLDVGYGTGVITHGIAELVAPDGQVVGVDINEQFVEHARVSHVVPALSFAVTDVHNLPFQERFDIATAARLLQWLAQGSYRGARGLASPETAQNFHSSLAPRV